jgi:hypothetical protein
MPPKKKALDTHTEQGQQLARRIYDYKIGQLENMSPAEKASLLKEFPLLTEADFQYVVKELLAAKRFEQEKVGWQTIPHDVTVLILVIVTSIFNLQIGIIAGIAVLVLLEGIFQFVFNQRIYRPLSLLVWLTYPAYILLALMLHQQGYSNIWIGSIVVLVWGGTYLLGAAARIPMRMFYEARAKSKQVPIK